MGIPRKLTRTQKVRSVFKSPYREIERIWAEHGVVKVQGKDGKVHIKTVRQAASIAIQLNQGLPPEGSTSRKHVLKLIEDVIQACREAGHQHEDPKNTEERAVTKAIQDHFTYDLNDSPELLQQIARLALEFSLVDRDEIRIILKKENMTEKFARDMLKEVQKDRADKLAKGITPQPDIFSI